MIKLRFLFTKILLVQLQVLFILIFISDSNANYSPIHYTLTIDKPHRHEMSVQIEYRTEGEEDVDFVMPAWTPGYYAIVNPVRNFYNFTATDQQGNPLNFMKIDKHTWRVTAMNISYIIFKYKVYAYNLSTPYSYHVETNFAFFNGPRTFMYIDGKKNAPVSITFKYPNDWDFHTALPLKIDENIYSAPDYDTFIDSPAFFGVLDIFKFEVRGKSHYVVMNGGYEPNRDQIKNDLIKMVEWFADMFGELPYERYTFFIRISNAGGGGMEHANSNVSCLTPAALTGDLDNPAYYDDLLMLECHEFFHVYNVKRIRPTGLGPFDYTKETYIRLLWVSEGFTSYYTHRPLAKAGIIPAQKIYPNWTAYYNFLHQNVSQNIKSVSQYSFDSWISKSDIPDYSYRLFYRKGALIALILDIDMRLKTDHEKNMDGFFRYLFEKIYKAGKTFNLEEFFELLNHYSELDYSEFFTKYVTGIEPLPVAKYLARAGLDLAPDEILPYLGIKADKSYQEAVIVHYVYPDSPADQLKISRGDQIISLNSEYVTPENWHSALKNMKIGENAEIEWRHHSSTYRRKVKIEENMVFSYKISQFPEFTNQQKEFFNKWLLP